MKEKILFYCMMAIVLCFSMPSAQAMAQEVCDCNTVATEICDEGGFLVGFLGFTPANQSTSGEGEFVYRICNESEGQCPVDTFRDLSHFSIALPGFGGSSCLSASNSVTFVQTAGQENALLTCDGKTQDQFCGFEDPNFVAKCDVNEGTTLDPGECVEMTLSIAGEQIGLGAGAISVLSKAAQNCIVNCLLGPSCDSCEGPPPEGEECLTRTIGFWGTHPHITDDLVDVNNPIEVCGNPVFDVDAGNCDSITEALCSSPGREFKSNPPYVTLIRQLAAAKLNLVATDALVSGAQCSSFMHQNKTIQEWIAICESTYCDASKSDISGSGCIEALDAFNSSDDSGFAQTPPPFDSPGPALPEQCHTAKGIGQDLKLVIGKNVNGGAQCLPTP